MQQEALERQRSVLQKEMGRASDFAFKENADLRVRMQIVTTLFETIMERANLPAEVKKDLKGVVQAALPPRDALDLGSEGSDSDKVDRYMESGHVFAERAQEIFLRLSRSTSAREHSFIHQADFTP